MSTTPSTASAEISVRTSTRLAKKKEHRLSIQQTQSSSFLTAAAVSSTSDALNESLSNIILHSKSSGGSVSSTTSDGGGASQLNSKYSSTGGAVSSTSDQAKNQKRKSASVRFVDAASTDFAFANSSSVKEANTDSTELHRRMSSAVLRALLDVLGCSIANFDGLWLRGELDLTVKGVRYNLIFAEQFASTSDCFYSEAKNVAANDSTEDAVGDLPLPVVIKSEPEPSFDDAVTIKDEIDDGFQLAENRTMSIDQISAVETSSEFQPRLNLVPIVLGRKTAEKKKARNRDNKKKARDQNNKKKKKKASASSPVLTGGSTAVRSKGEKKVGSGGLQKEIKEKHSEKKSAAGALSTLVADKDGASDVDTFYESCAFVCYLCDQVLRGPRAVRSHHSSTHQGSLLCPECQWCAESLCGLANHMHQQHSAVVAQSLFPSSTEWERRRCRLSVCGACGLRVASAYLMLLHLLRRHANNQGFVCRRPSCQLGGRPAVLLVSRRDYTDHMWLEHQEHGARRSIELDLNAEPQVLSKKKKLALALDDVKECQELPMVSMTYNPNDAELTCNDEMDKQLSSIHADCKDAFYGEGQFTCPVCSMILRGTTQVQRHCRQLKCPSCPKICTNVLGLQHHVHEQHGLQHPLFACGASYCSACKLQTSSSFLMAIHLMEKHTSEDDEVGFFCPVRTCLEGLATPLFGQRNVLLEHLRTAHRATLRDLEKSDNKNDLACLLMPINLEDGSFCPYVERPVVCFMCNTHLKDIRTAWRHFVGKHQQRFQCEMCTKKPDLFVASSVRDLQRHYRLRHPHSPLFSIEKNSCTPCGLHTSSNFLMVIHILSSHEDFGFICSHSDCSLNTPAASTSASHLIIYGSKDDLDRHTLTAHKTTSLLNNVVLDEKRLLSQPSAACNQLTDVNDYDEPSSLSHCVVGAPPAPGSL